MLKQVVIHESGKSAEVTIDGVKISGIYALKIEKTPDSPIKIELSGRVTNEVRIET